jgi:hypothetical protein
MLGPSSRHYICLGSLGPKDFLYIKELIDASQVEVQTV